jgi:O-antigen/teichoic acid export membrane protein
LEGVLAASQRFDLINALGIPFSALSYFLPVIGLALGLGLPAIVLFLVLARVVAFLVMVFICLRLYPSLRGGVRFSHRLVRSLLGYGGWVSVSVAVSPILVYLDRFVIGSVISIAAVGFYTPSFMIATKLEILSASLAPVLFPAFSTSAGRGDHRWIKDTLIRSLKLLLLVVGPATLLLIFFSGPLLTVWLGPQFAAEGTVVLQVLAVGVFLDSLASVPRTLLAGVGRPDIPSKFNLFELPLHVGLVWFLSTRFGLPGAALACTVRVSLDFVLLVIAACRFTRTSLRHLASRELGRSTISLLGFAAGLFVLWDSTHAFVVDVVFAAFLGTVFLLASWHYLLDLGEKARIRSWLKKAR